MKGQYPHLSKLIAYKEQILQWLEANISGIRIHGILKKQGLNISYSLVKIFLRSIKSREEICVQFHTGPGEQAQVDFDYVGQLPDKNGKLIKFWIFNMRLSSR